ncbi:MULTISPECIES: DMT family transporter [unclassified Paenibacillus]|uniref:DMT family transporter n=1 Tax=unclassified Paenibacillus TaxID=185978 RepID=UPI0007BEE36E|nr:MULTISPECIES: DMT family transporter [unclassified Paenibacillus]SHN63124.1 Permease of the drug/metabolite transporter (DMT) superfamily [Paenibacillus sp. ov031]SLJ90214.1 Permease of the drug/metabolite transporter (DMT) superfamily [Paenibacillus sp. RU5A]SOC59057.1 Permease of the drug/metabolite transporter (DMT) superfamily [Paenibacillus sp. RU26A]SOC68108.1 Permease of the drug/metabolite transporter (DMT) superfamily [Paenibacillus sp. RU5M]
MTGQNKISTGHLLALLTILIWGTTFISTKVLLIDFTPVEILFFRFVIGYVVLFLIYPQLMRITSLREEMLFIVAGLCGVTLYFLIENIALVYTLASNVGVIVSIAPFFTAVLAHFFLDGERLQKRFILGFAIALSGIILIGFNGSFILQLNPLGDLLAFVAPAVWAIYSVLMRKIGELPYHTIGATRKVFFYGLLFMLPALFLFEFHFDLGRFANMTNLSNLLFLGLGASALCFVTWNRAVSLLGAVKTSVYIYLVPVITVVASALILHERITWITLLGALLTLLGSFISEKKVHRKDHRSTLPELE